MVEWGAHNKVTALGSTLFSFAVRALKTSISQQKNVSFDGYYSQKLPYIVFISLSKIIVPDGGIFYR